MDTMQTLLAVLHADPGDEMARLALADWLEEQGNTAQAELLRLHVTLRTGQGVDREGVEFQRMTQLLESGVRPVVPTLNNVLGMTFALLPAGRCGIGSPFTEESRFDDEGPVHEVTLTRPFYLGIYPVTQGEYRSLMGHNPSYFSAEGGGAERVADLDTSRHPVESLSWDEATVYCQRLSEKTGQVCRLPTEAEWEYACRAGLSNECPFHQGRTLTSFQANFDGREPFGDAHIGPFLRRTVPVDAFPPNAFGLFDLHGNVSEWCQDWFDEAYYRQGAMVDPTGPLSGEHRVLRGGSWTDPGKYCRAAFRYDRPAEEGRRDFGMRIVVEHPR